MCVGIITVVVPSNDPTQPCNFGVMLGGEVLYHLHCVQSASIFCDDSFFGSDKLSTTTTSQQQQQHHNGCHENPQRCLGGVMDGMGWDARVNMDK